MAAPSTTTEATTAVSDKNRHVGIKRKIEPDHEQFNHKITEFVSNDKDLKSNNYDRICNVIKAQQQVRDIKMNMNMNMNAKKLKTNVQQFAPIKDRLTASALRIHNSSRVATDDTLAEPVDDLAQLQLLKEKCATTDNNSVQDKPNKRVKSVANANAFATRNSTISTDNASTRKTKNSDINKNEELMRSRTRIYMEKHQNWNSLSKNDYKSKNKLLISEIQKYWAEYAFGSEPQGLCDDSVTGFTFHDIKNIENLKKIKLNAEPLMSDIWASWLTKVEKLITNDKKCYDYLLLAAGCAYECKKLSMMLEKSTKKSEIGQYEKSINSYIAQIWFSLYSTINPKL